MPVPANRRQFDKLLTAFRAGHAKYGGGGFTLYVLPSERSEGYFRSPACEHVGSILTRETEGSRAISGYGVFGDFRGENWALSRDALDLFVVLARRAGAALPVKAQQALSVKQNDPTSSWLALMWLHSPPYDDQFDSKKLWPEPFLSAANAIERGALCTVDDDAEHAARPETPPANAPTAEKPVDPIPITWLRSVVPNRTVRGDASKLAEWLRRRQVRVFKIANRNHAERADLLVAFHRHSTVCQVVREHAGVVS